MLDRTDLSPHRHGMTIPQDITRNEMAVEEGRRNNGSQAAKGETDEESDLTLMTFSASRQTVAAWQQLKRDRSLDSSQLVAFLLQWYADTRHLAVCPHCQSALQHFCAACSTVISTSRQGDPNHLTPTTTIITAHSSLPEKRSDQSSTKKHTHPSETALPKEKSDYTGMKTVHTFPHTRYKSKRCASVSSESNCSLDEVDEDHEMNDRPEWNQEESDSTDEVGDYEENRSEVTKDRDAADELEECEPGTDREKLCAPQDISGMKRESPTTLRTERMETRTCKEASVQNIDNEMRVHYTGSGMTTDNNNKISIDDLKIEAQAVDSKENKGHDMPESSKPDIASCTWCDLSFKTIVALTKHLTVHTTLSWQHQHFPHAKHKTANCQRSAKNTDRTCKLKTKTRANRSTRSQKRTDVKSESVVFEESLEKNALAATNKRVFRCVQCREGWKTPVGLTYHIQSAHLKKNTYQCLKCSRTFSSLRGIAFHMRTHPAKRMRERDPVTHPHQCGQCGLRFMHVGNLANHMEKHTGPSQLWCSQCQRVFQSLTDLTGHQCQLPSLQNRDSGDSQSCQAFTISLSGTVKEVPEDHKSEMVDNSLFLESINDRSESLEEKEVASGDLAEDNHRSKKPGKRGRKRKTVSLTMKEVKRPYKCTECPASFLHASVLKVHSQKHSGQKAFPCSQCEQSFTSKTKLYAHQEKDHWGSIPITCQDCGKVFATARTLDEHRVLHTGERPYVCHTCGEAFPYRTALTRHRRTHRASYFKCTDCGAEFHLKSEYRHHMDEHRAIRPHLCSHCGQSFSSLTLLKQHVDKHGQKQFVCELCGKAFRKKGEHKMHLMTHQTVKPFPCPLCERSFVSRSKLQLHNSIAHLHLKPHTCQQCDAGFTSATYLKDHVRFAHTTERPFACSLCLSCFAAKRFLKLHLKRTHKNKSESVSAEGELNSASVLEQSSV